MRPLIFTSGNTVLEAFACGVPVVVPRTQGFQDTVRHDETGNTTHPHTLSTLPIEIPPYYHTLSTHTPCQHTPFQHTLSRYRHIDIPYHYIISTHPIKTPYDTTKLVTHPQPLSTNSINTPPYQRTLSIYRHINALCQHPPLSVHTLYQHSLSTHHMNRAYYSLDLLHSTRTPPSSTTHFPSLTTTITTTHRFFI